MPLYMEILCKSVSFTTFFSPYVRNAESIVTVFVLIQLFGPYNCTCTHKYNMTRSTGCTAPGGGVNPMGSRDLSEPAQGATRALEECKGGTQDICFLGHLCVFVCVYECDLDN